MPAQTVLIGGDELKRVLARLSARAPAIAGGALYRETERIMTAAKRRTPVKWGNLRASGHVLPPETRGGRIVVTLGFGGPAGSGTVGDETNWEHVGYAIYVHENLTARHTVGEAKYLERPLLEAVRGMETRLAADIGKELERAAR